MNLGGVKVGLLSLLFDTNKLRDTIFIKEFSEENQLLRDLEELSNRVTSDKKKYIERDANLLKIGLSGEKNVYYELKNSFIPMYCLHDIRLEYKDYVAQFDFIIITSKFIYVLETKKLVGDIQINSDGEFIRFIKDRNGKLIKREGMASPISQNQKHIDILRKLLVDIGFIESTPVKSLVVVANSKTVVDKKYAPKIIKEAICKYDNVAAVIKKELGKESPINLQGSRMKVIADFLNEANKVKKFDLIGKYSLSEEDFIVQSVEHEEQLIKDAVIAEEPVVEEIVKTNEVSFNSDEELEKRLKSYRLDISRATNIKPYFVFNNEALCQLLIHKPRSIEELSKVRGFGEKNIEKYGQAIIHIINQC